MWLLTQECVALHMLIGFVTNKWSVCHLLFLIFMTLHLMDMPLPSPCTFARTHPLLCVVFHSNKWHSCGWVVVVMGKRSARFRVAEKRFQPLSCHNGPSNPHVCAICKFVALDGPGLQMHFFESPYCANAECSLAAALPEFDDEQHFCENDDIDDNADQHFSDDPHNDIHSPSAKVARLSSPVDVSNPNTEDNDAGEYEFVSEHKFPANVGDEVHVELVELCRQIGAPLYAYNKILAWSQDAHAKGYMFPVTAPKYDTFMADKMALHVYHYA